jgi:uncharacterized SAM-binding protein YcdF (DUF218 family)
MTDIHMGTRSRRWVVRIIALIVLVCVIALVVPTIRMRFLRAAGWALVVPRQAIQSADIIVVAIDAHGAGTLEAADLVHSGVATRVAVFATLPDARADSEFLRRGIPYEDPAAVSIRQLQALGIDNVEQIARTVAGSEEEGEVLPAWCDQHHYRAVVVVTTSDHSRRLRRILARSMQGHQTSITVQPAHYSTFDPDRWWQTRGGTRTEIFELEKLLLDLVRHPFS